LVVVELELLSEAEAIPIPDWLGDDVTLDGRYANANLVRMPYSEWK